jgi:hypothetical protein
MNTSPVKHDLIALMMEAASTSETSVNFYQTARRNIPEDSHLHDLLSSLSSPCHFNRIPNA